VRISAVIPTYNHAHYLPQAVESVLAQTRPPDEVIVVDDGSCDETPAVVQAYAPGVRYIRQENRGLSAARNTGMREASNEWVAFLDADDWWLPDKLRMQEAALAANPSAVLCYCGVLYHHSDGTTSERRATNPGSVMPELRLRNCVTGSGSAVCLRRSVLMALGGFGEHLTAYEDWDAWIRLAVRYPFTAVSEPLACIRVTPNSMSQNLDRMLRNLEIVCNTSILEGLSGWRREFWRRRLLSREMFRMAILAREAGSPRLRKLLWDSIRAWPLPGEVPKRSRFIALELFRYLGVGL